MLYRAKGRDQAGSYQRHYLGQPNYHLCHILGQRGQVNNGVGGERPEQETDRLGGGAGSIDVQGQAKAKAPGLNLGAAEQAALGSLYTWLLCQEGNSALESLNKRHTLTLFLGTMAGC